MSLLHRAICRALSLFFTPEMLGDRSKGAYTAAGLSVLPHTYGIRLDPRFRDLCYQLGDSLRAIALVFHSTQAAIIAANPTVITDPNALVAGQVINIPVNIATQVPTAVPTSTKSTTKTNTPLPPTATATP